MLGVGVAKEARQKQKMQASMPGKEISEIREYIVKGNFRITDHAFEEMKADGLIFQDVIAGVMSGEVIENYSRAYPLLASLINGKTESGQPIHVCISLPPLVKVITVYRPDPEKWTEDFCKRRLEGNE